MNTQAQYIFSPELKEAIHIAQITQRPLLIKGEPGTGKTLLAEQIAKEKNTPLYQWSIKSTTQARDGLYFYDAVTRLNDSRFSDGKRDVSDIKSYIRFEPMGQAFLEPRSCVLLIDEIDKADIEFPNDLLMELDRMEFRIQETGELIRAQARPFVIITSNNEKELPDAFLRRCIFHYIEFPKPAMMEQIVLAHFPSIKKNLLDSAINSFYKLRDVPDFKKHPTTSELIDWINILMHNGADTSELKNFPFAGCLLKNEDDMLLLKRLRP